MPCEKPLDRKSIPRYLNIFSRGLLIAIAYDSLTGNFKCLNWNGNSVRIL